MAQKTCTLVQDRCWWWYAVIPKEGLHVDCPIHTKGHTVKSPYYAVGTT